VGRAGNLNEKMQSETRREGGKEVPKVTGCLYEQEVFRKRKSNNQNGLGGGGYGPLSRVKRWVNLVYGSEKKKKKAGGKKLLDVKGVGGDVPTSKLPF